MEANTRRIKSYKCKLIKSPNNLQNLLMFIAFINKIMNVLIMKMPRFAFLRYGKNFRPKEH